MNIILFDHLDATNTLAATDYRARHIKGVLRLGIGEHFVAGVINGSSGTATLLASDTEQLTFSYSAEAASEALHPLTLIVVQVRPISMRRILREAVSLGVGTLILSGADSAEKSYASAKLYSEGEYRSILIDGAMQSGKTAIPPVHFAHTIAEAIELAGSDAERIVMDNKERGERLSTMVLEQEQPVVLAIGGERGFSDRERSLFRDASYRFATIGERVLRTETAVSAATAVLLGRMGRI